MNKIRTTILVKVNPTEDPEKVKRSVQNVFPTLDFKRIPQKRGYLLTTEVYGKAGLSKLYDLLRRERILDAARATLFKGTDGNKITFYLNKQVAYVGHVSFCEPVGESSLGPIKVDISCDDAKELIDWLAPRSI